jgi:hypothetical protein
MERLLAAELTMDFTPLLKFLFWDLTLTFNLQHDEKI